MPKLGTREVPNWVHTGVSLVVQILALSTDITMLEILQLYWLVQITQCVQCEEIYKYPPCLFSFGADFRYIMFRINL